MTRSTSGRRRWKYGVAGLTLTAALAALSPPEPALASRHCAPVKRSAPDVALIARGITTYGGVTCRAGRTVVAQFFVLAIREGPEGCAGQSLTSDGCPVAGWICKRTVVSNRGRCVHLDGGRVVRWHERDVEIGGP